MMKHLLLSALPLVFAAFAMAAGTLPDDCVKRVQQLAAQVPGDDGTFSSPSDVIISNVQATSHGAGAATGVPYTNYSADVAVAGFTGTASVSDSAGSCYILHFDIAAP